MSRKSLNSILVLGVALLFTACAQQAQQEQAPPAETETPAETAEPAMGAPMELTPEKVMELAGMAAQIEANPAMVADLLTQHGMTQMQWDEAMTKIAADTTMAAAFAQAKTAAAAAAPAAAAPAAGGH
jgi:PBP1b-binding outer membrane lipoprotein LpoB